MRRKKRLLSWLLCVAMLFSFMPQMAFAEEGTKEIDGVTYTVGTPLEENGDPLYLDGTPGSSPPTVPTYYQAGATEENYILYHPGDEETGPKVTLHGATFSTNQTACIQLAGGTTVVLIGENSLTHSGSEKRCIYVASGDLTVQGPGTLTTNIGNGLDVSNGSLKICNKATINANYNNGKIGLKSNNGDLTIEGSTVAVKMIEGSGTGNGGQGAIFVNGQSEGTQSSIKIINSTVTAIDPTAPAIHSFLGGISLTDSNVTAIGAATVDRSSETGAMGYNSNNASFYVNGGTLRVKNLTEFDSSEYNYDICPYSSTKMTTSNNAVIYYGGPYLLISKGSNISHTGCDFDEEGYLQKDFSGTRNIYGTVDAEALSKLPDTPISIKSGGNLVNNGTFQTDYLIDIRKGGTLTNTGTLSTRYGISNILGGNLSNTGTLNGVVKEKLNGSEGSYTAHGEAVYNEEFVELGTSGAGVDYNLIVPNGSKLTIPDGSTLDASLNGNLTAEGLNQYLQIDGELENLGTMILPEKTTSEQIAALNPTGTGEIQVMGSNPDSPAETVRTVTVEGSYADSSGAGFYAQDNTVTIDAGTRSGYTFDGWTSNDGVVFADKNSPNTTFTMLNQAVTVTANWKKAGGGTGGGTIIPPEPPKPDISTGDGYETEVDKNGTLTIKVDNDYELEDVLVNGESKGPVTSLSGLKTGDKVEIVVISKEDKNNAYLKKGVEDTAIKAWSESTKGRIRVYFKKEAGFKVDGYEFFRTTKKSNFGKKPYYVSQKTTAKYLNNTKNLKKGTRYYYKIRGYRTIAGELVYTQWSNIASRPAK